MIQRMGPHSLHCFQPVLCLLAAVVVFSGQQARQHTTVQLAVVDDEDSEGFGGC
jgi:hypothetical protein